MTRSRSSTRKFDTPIERARPASLNFASASHVSRYLSCFGIGQWIR